MLISISVLIIRKKNENSWSGKEWKLIIRKRMKTHDQEKNENLWSGKEWKLIIRKRIKTHYQENNDDSWSGEEWRLMIRKRMKTHDQEMNEDALYKNALKKYTFLPFLNPWVLRISGRDRYAQKCDMTKPLHSNVDFW
jgi:hypothetical protein